MKKSSRCKTPAKLSSSLHRQLNAYALTASAAGMGALALPRAAQAKIIYTPADQSVPFIALDLNHDGIADFAITASVLNTTNGAGYAMQAYGLVGPNGIVQAHYGQPTYLAALHDGARIGANAFIFGGPMARTNVSNTNHQKHFFGPWANHGQGVKNRYLGFKFLIQGEVHYGWARLNVRPGTAYGTLTGYAYETIPNKAIIAGKTHGTDDGSIEQPDSATLGVPEPGSLGRLAQGASSFQPWRKESAGSLH